MRHGDEAPVTTMCVGKQRASEPRDEGPATHQMYESPASNAGARSVGPCEGAEDDHKGGIQLHVQACPVG